MLPDKVRDTVIWVLLAALWVTVVAATLGVIGEYHL